MIVDPQEVIRDMNRKYFVATVGNKVMIGYEYMDEHGNESLDFINEHELKKRYRHTKVRLGTDSKYVPTHADYWLQHECRRMYDRVRFDPSNKLPQNYYNRFRGFNVKPVEGDCSMIVDFISDIICSGDEKMRDYILDYLAHMVQKPEQLPRAAIMLRGDEGAGKGTFGRLACALVAPHSIQITDPKSVLERFNAPLANKICMFLDESDVAMSQQCSENIKGLITEPTISYEQKYQPRQQVANYGRIILATNNKHSLRMDSKSRRFCTVLVSNKHLNDLDYFADLNDHIDNGGLEVFSYHLYRRDIKGFRPERIPVSIEAMRQMYLSLHSSHEKWWMEKLIVGEDTDDRNIWNGTVPVAVLYNEYEEYCLQVGIRNKATPTSFGKFLIQKVGAVADKGKKMEGGNRQAIYRINSLEDCRSGACRYYGCEWPWGELAKLL